MTGLAVEAAGPRGAPVLLFLHGSGTNGSMWSEVVRRLPGYRCLVADLPGHRHSAAVRWTSLADAADRVADLLQETEGTGVRAGVVGLSLGGEVAYLLLARHPEVLSGAVIDGAAIVPSRLAPLFKTAVGVISPFLHRGAVTRTLGKALGVPAGDLPRFEEGMLSVAPSTFRRAFNQAQDPGVLPEVLACRVPTLLVNGERELADMHAANAALAAHMPHAQARVVPGAGHGWVGSRPDLHARMVDAWMSGAALPEELRPERRSSAESPTGRRVAAAAGATSGPA